MYNEWWEIPQNCDCLFALDSKSILEDSGSKINFSNPSSNFFNTIGLVKNKVTQSNCHGFEVKDYLVNYNKLFKFSSLKLNDVVLTFKNPEPLITSRTWVLKCVVNGTTKLSSGEENSTNYGLTFAVGREYNDIHNYNWRVIGTNTAQNLTIDNRKKLPYNSVIHTVVLKVDVETGVQSIESNLGTVIGNNDGVGLDINYVLKYIGYPSQPYTNPKVDIVAFGLFDKILSQEELTQVFEKIDTQFKNSADTLESKFKAYEGILLVDKEDMTAPFKNEAYFGSYTINKNMPQANINIDINIYNDHYIVHALYKNLKEIEDVVLEEGVPTSTKLFLYERKTGFLIKTTTSDINGFFKFYNLNENNEYLVTSNDNKYQFQSIIKNYNKINKG